MVILLCRKLKNEQKKGAASLGTGTDPEERVGKQQNKHQKLCAQLPETERTVGEAEALGT